MIDELLNVLRYRSEGTDVDFKSAQYRFTGGSEDDKAELLKDILAMANAWRDGTGYIVLGFKEQRPHPAEVVGIAESVDDSRMQQFVNNKVKPKLTFQYEEHLYAGKTIGIITIPKQKRAFYIAHAYGKLKSNVVYVRRGSSTDEAEPPEIAAMTLADMGRGDMRVDLSVLTPKNEKLPDTFTLKYLQFTEIFPDFESPKPLDSPSIISVAGPWRDNRRYWSEYAEYIRLHSGLIVMKFVLLNRSDVQLSKAKLEVSVHALDDQEFQMLDADDLPVAPKKRWNIFEIVEPPNIFRAHQKLGLSIDDSGLVPGCHVHFGSLLPGEEACSDTLAICLSSPGEVRLRFRILASELAKPQESERIIKAIGSSISLNFEDLKAF